MRQRRTVIAGLLLLGATCQLLADQSSRGAPPPLVDTSQLMRDVAVLASDEMQGRRAGSEGAARARAYIRQRYQEIGLRPAVPRFEQRFSFGGSGAARQTGVNLLAMIPGTRTPDRVIVVTAHYDHIGVRDGQIYNGADDNASGVAGLLAVAEHFKKQPTQRSLLLAALDAEESGLHGARALLASGPVQRDRIVVNVNIDMIGRDAANVLYAAGPYHYPALRPLLAGIGQPPIDLRFGHDAPNVEAEDWTRDSDHFPFHEAGIPFVYFGVEDFENHHKPSDDAATIQREFFAGAVRTIIVAVERLSGAPELRSAGRHGG